MRILIYIFMATLWGFWFLFGWKAPVFGLYGALWALVMGYAYGRSLRHKYNDAVNGANPPPKPGYTRHGPGNPLIDKLNEQNRSGKADMN